MLVDGPQCLVHLVRIYQVCRTIAPEKNDGCVCGKTRLCCAQGGPRSYTWASSATRLACCLCSCCHISRPSLGRPNTADTSSSISVYSWHSPSAIVVLTIAVDAPTGRLELTVVLSFKVSVVNLVAHRKFLLYAALFQSSGDDHDSELDKQGCCKGLVE